MTSTSPNIHVPRRAAPHRPTNNQQQSCNREYQVRIQETLGIHTPKASHSTNSIPASQELQDAFNTLVSSQTQRGLVAGISNEQLVPLSTLAASSSSSPSSLSTDLASLQPHLQPNAAAYILLKLEASAADGYAAITYVPDSAPVRQKMLFAATRLTLVRELGVERFRETLFVTTKAELTADGWAKHQSHVALQAPLTDEERSLAGVREAEDAESRGTGARKSHVSSGLALDMDHGLVDGLRELGGGAPGRLVQVVRHLDSLLYGSVMEKLTT